MTRLLFSLAPVPRASGGGRRRPESLKNAFESHRHCHILVAVVVRACWTISEPWSQVIERRNVCRQRGHGFEYRVGDPVAGLTQWQREDVGQPNDPLDQSRGHAGTGLPSRMMRSPHSWVPSVQGTSWGRAVILTNPTTGPISSCRNGLHGPRRSGRSRGGFQAPSGAHEASWTTVGVDRLMRHRPSLPSEDPGATST